MDVKNIFQKICDELGGDYRMFFCNSPTPLQSEAFNLALATPKVVGVGYVSNGNYIPLVDSTAEQVTLFIEFGVPTKQTEQRLAEIEEVITALNAKYGEITYVNDSGDVDMATKYVMVFSKPAPTAAITPSLGQLRQTFGVMAQIVTSADVAFGNAATVQIQSSEYFFSDLENTVSAQWTNTNEVIPRVGINSFSSSVEAQYASDRLVVNYYYNGSSLHRLLESHAVNDSNVTYTLKYKQNNVSTTFKARMLSYTHSNPVGGFQQVTAVFARASVDSIQESFVLTINPAAHSTITVTREGVALSSGDLVYAGDVLRVSSTAATGYTLTSLTVNGVAIESGKTYTVNTNEPNGVNVMNTVRSGTVQTFVLSVSAALGSTITVTKDNTPLQNGSIIQEGDVIKIIATPKTGYDITSLKVNGSNFTSGNTLTVSGDVSVETQAMLQSFVLTANIGFKEGIAGEAVKGQVNLKIYRTANYYGVSENTVILDSDNGTPPMTVNVNYGDVLKYVYTITDEKKFKLYEFTINDEEMQNNAQTVVTGTVTVDLLFDYLLYTFTIDTSKSAGAVNITATGAGGVVLSSGSKVHSGEQISITFDSRSTGYSVFSYSIVNNSQTDTEYPGNTLTTKQFNAAGNVTVSCTAASVLQFYDYDMNMTSSRLLIYGDSYILPTYTDENYYFVQWISQNHNYTAGESYSGPNASFIPSGYPIVRINGFYTYVGNTTTTVVCKKYFKGELTTLPNNKNGKLYAHGNMGNTTWDCVWDENDTAQSNTTTVAVGIPAPTTITFDYIGTVPYYGEAHNEWLDSSNNIYYKVNSIGRQIDEN